MTSLLQLLIIFLSMIGIADAGFITYEELMGVTPVCHVGSIFDCGAVLDSPWAHIGPVPLSVLGLGFYSTMFLIGAIIMTVPTWRPQAIQLAALLGVMAGLFSVFLMYLQLGVIGALCLYCTISAFTSGGLALVSVALWRQTQTVQGKNKERDDSAAE